MGSQFPLKKLWLSAQTRWQIAIADEYLSHKMIGIRRQAERLLLLRGKNALNFKWGFKDSIRLKSLPPDEPAGIRLLLVRP